MDQLNRLSIDEFKSTKKNALVFLLDDIRSLNNVGSAFRTADAFALEKIVLCGITGTPPNREINKTALGATESVQWAYEKNAIDAVQSLKNENYKIICIEQTKNAMPLYQFMPEKNQKYCFVFGNEVFGVNDQLIEASDLCVEIPQFGTKHSLNVSVVMGIIGWDYILKSMTL